MGSNFPSRPPPSTEVSAHDIQLLADRRVIDERHRGIERVLSQLGVPKKDHDDLVQTVMLRATEARDRYNPALGTVQGWVEGIARNAVREHRRQYRCKHAWLVPESDAPSVEPQAPGLNPEQLVHTRRALGALEQAMPKPVEPVLAMYAEGHTRAEIMEETGVSAGKLACHLRRLAAARDKVVRAMREKRKTVLGVRFCLLPWWLLTLLRKDPPPSLREEESAAAPRPPGVSPPLDPPPHRRADPPCLRTWPRWLWPRAHAALATAAILTVAPRLGLLASSDSSRTTAAAVALPQEGFRAPTLPTAGEPPPRLPTTGRPPPRATPTSPTATASTLPSIQAPPAARRTGATPALQANVPSHASTGRTAPVASAPLSSAVPYRLLRLASQATYSEAGDVAASSLQEHARRYGASGAAERAQLAHVVRTARPR
jgi:DNA-directed RNA polymerase specialized sigma24 family protein